MPPTVVIPVSYGLERLDTARHSRENFSCGKEDLDTYLRTQASQSQARYLSATYVLIPTAPADATVYPIAGYVTLVSSEIPLQACPPKLKKVTNKSSLPILLLARMATDVQHKGRRIGECLLMHALSKAWEMKENSGCVAVFVDAKDNDAKSFYTKYGFVPLPENSMRLFLEMALIEKLK